MAYDVIVAGVGGMGSAALHHLARRGKRVLGLERFDIPHEMGSSHGISRIIRLAYYEHPDYVPLLQRAYQLWRELQTEAGEQLLFITGSVDAGPADGPLFQGSLASCREHGLPHQALDSAELSRRFPGYRLPPSFMALYQEEGGILASERCIVAHTARALAAGAEVRAREQLLEWTLTPEGVRVRTDRGSYEAGALVLTAGAWGPALTDALHNAVPQRQVVGWFQPLEPAHFQLANFPVFNLAAEEGRYYGFPVFGVPGFKIGRYMHRNEDLAHADRCDRHIHPEDEEVLRVAMRAYFPASDGPTLGLRTCMFTNSPDEHFLLGPHPEDARVVLAGGFSGHGFKFCSVIGEILADLALEGATRHPIGFLSPQRFACAC